MFSTCRLYATIFDGEADGAAIVQMIRAIGSDSAAKIKRLNILYSKKKDLKYIMTSLMRDLKLAGINTTEGAVEVTRWTQEKTVPHQRFRDRRPHTEEEEVAMPGCQCEFCIVQYLRDQD